MKRCIFAIGLIIAILLEVATWLCAAEAIDATIAASTSVASSPAHVVAIAEAYTKAVQARRRELPNDFIVEPASPVSPVTPASEPNEPSAADTRRFRYHVTVYTMAHCIPCRDMRVRYDDGDARVSLDWTDDSPPAGYPALRPLTVWSNATGQVLYIVGATTPDEIVRKIEDPRNGPAPPKVADDGMSGDAGRINDAPAASAAAGSIRCRSVVEPAIAAVRSRLPDGARVSIRWHRSGVQAFPLLKAGAAWSVGSVFGEFGRFELATDATSVPVQALGFSYRVHGQHPGELVVDPDPITLRGFVTSLQDSPQSPQSSQSVDAVGVDPATILTVLSVLHSLWQMLNPSADLELGGTVAADMDVTGDTLRFTFTGGPRIRVRAFWQWLLEVQSVDVSASSLVIRFSDQPGAMFPIRERRFSLE